MPAAARTQRPPLRLIQALRGFAALAVVGFHTHVILGHPQYGAEVHYGWLLGKGWLGVNFFFVLSGFIIYYAHAADIGRPELLGRYIQRRVVRLYPVYWILLTGFIAAAALGIGHPEIKWDALHLFTAYSLLPVVDMPVLPLKVAWTLLFEIKFYIAFCLLIISPRIGMLVFATWAMLIVFRAFLSPAHDWGYLLPDWGMLSIWNLNFHFGMAAAMLLTWPTVRSAAAIFALGIVGAAIFASGMPDMSVSSARPLLMGLIALSFGLIILGGAAIERKCTVPVPYPFMLLGDASYSIYLSHSAVISQIGAVAYRFFPNSIPAPILYGGTFLAATAAGTLVHLLIEKPVLRWARSRFEA